MDECNLKCVYMYLNMCMCERLCVNVCVHNVVLLCMLLHVVHEICIVFIPNIYIFIMEYDNRLCWLSR